MKSRQFQPLRMVNNDAHACVIYSHYVTLYIIWRGLLFYYLKVGSLEPHEGSINNSSHAFFYYYKQPTEGIGWSKLFDCEKNGTPFTCSNDL
jgi:hypothetical protein